MPYAAFVGDFINRVLISQNFRTKARSFFLQQIIRRSKTSSSSHKARREWELELPWFAPEPLARFVQNRSTIARHFSTEVKIPIYRTEKAVYNNKLHTILMSLIEPRRRITGIYSTQSTVNMCLWKPKTIEFIQEFHWNKRKNWSQCNIHWPTQ